MITGATVATLWLARDAGDERADVSTTAPTTTVPATDPPPAPSPVVIELFEFTFPGTVTAGVPFDVANLDGADHTLTDRDDTFEAYVFADGHTELVVPRPGRYEVWCRIHPSMVGTLVVGG
jgi:hypothetical protein